MFADLGRIMKLAGQMKTRLPEIQARLAEKLYTAHAGDGAVCATVNGKLVLVDLHINRQLFADPQANLAAVEEMIKSAVSSAQEQAAQAAKQAMKELTGGLEIPGITP